MKAEMTYEDLTRELVKRISAISDDFHPSRESENGLALQEMREALEDLTNYATDVEKTFILRETK